MKNERPTPRLRTVRAASFVKARSLASVLRALSRILGITFEDGDIEQGKEGFTYSTAAEPRSPFTVEGGPLSVTVWPGVVIIGGRCFLLGGTFATGMSEFMVCIQAADAPAVQSNGPGVPASVTILRARPEIKVLPLSESMIAPAKISDTDPTGDESLVVVPGTITVPLAFYDARGLRLVTRDNLAILHEVNGSTVLASSWGLDG